MRTLRALSLATLAALMAFLATPTEAKPRRAPVLELEGVRVDVVVEGPVVQTTIEQTWRNPGAERREIDLLLPIPAGAAVTEYRMEVEGEALPAELLPRAEAKRAYVETVRRMQDPALLKHAGDRAVRLRAFPVEPGATRTVRLAYRQALASVGGLLRHAVVPAPDRLEHDRIGTLDVRVRVSADGPLVALYSPTHALDVTRTGERTAEGHHKSRRARPSDEVLIYVATSAEPSGMRLLVHRAEGEDGTFLLLGAPRAPAVKAELAPRTVLFVFDRSGSMKGRKVEQVRGALRFCMLSLTPRDRFNLFTFSDAVERVFERPTPAEPDAVEHALGRIASIEADGGTNIQEALLAALDDVPAGEQADVVFLTDGLPTVGEKDVGKIRQAVAARNEGRARLFTFGVGDDVNVTFLDKLALEANGFPTVVRPTEDVEVAVSGFFKGITAPTLRGLSIVGDGVELYDIQPRILPDLFHGTTLHVLGRYRPSKEGALVLRGTRGEEVLTFRTGADFQTPEAEHAWLPALWAARRIGHLIDDIRAQGPEPELVDSVVTLARRHGIVTEYTAFLLDMDEADPALVRARATEAFRDGGAAWQGGWAQSQVRGKEMMKRAHSIAEAGGFHDRDGRWVDLSRRVARVGSLVFLRDREGTWVDVRVTGDRHAQRVSVGSDRYRQLVESSDLFARVAGLGAPILLRWEGADLQIVE
ncbi:MAG: VIT domain-containing protein [Planctomycetota bacterium]|nr:VIT domain-containing protein [Planctomycetota bacterium]